MGDPNERGFPDDLVGNVNAKMCDPERFLGEVPTAVSQPREDG
jgi:hypothetical protein